MIYIVSIDLYSPFFKISIKYNGFVGWLVDIKSIIICTAHDAEGSSKKPCFQIWYFVY